MARIEILVEEPSMAEFLRIILPNLLPAEWVIDNNIFIRKHQGKSDLRKSIPVKLKAFSHWHEPIGFIIMQDQDSNDCRLLKQELIDLCSPHKNIPTLIRIVCRELESWYIGDMEAIQKAYPEFKARTYSSKSKFRNPDLCNAKDELKKILPAYQETSAARNITPHISINTNRSESFRQFVNGLLVFIQNMP